MLNLFKKKMNRADRLSQYAEEESKDEAKETGCSLHGVPGCKSCRDTFGQSEETSDKGWMAHRLKFEKTPGVKDARNDPNELVVIDPRKKMEELRNSRKRT